MKTSTFIAVLLFICKLSLAQDTSKVVKQITPTVSGQPGKDIVVRICTPSRGQVLAHQPLYVVYSHDKIISRSAQVDLLKSINPQNIESMTVLKDTTSRAKYGKDAAYGVVEITLKDK